MIPLTSLISIGFVLYEVYMSLVVRFDFDGSGDVSKEEMITGLTQFGLEKFAPILSRSKRGQKYLQRRRGDLLTRAENDGWCAHCE